jgi:hypothetical protein
MTAHDDMADRPIQEWIAKLFDDELSGEEFEALAQRLRDDPAARELYAQYLWLETALDAVHAWPLGRAARPIEARRTAKWALGLAVAAVAVLVCGLYLFQVSRPPVETRLRVCGSSQWTLQGEMNRPLSTLPHGSEFLLQQGVAELKLPNGVKGIIEGPASLILVDDMTLRLDHGRALFQVTPESRGFTVLTARHRIVDLGTEFGIDARKDGKDLELHVFKGRVRVDALSGTAEGEILTAGKSVVLDGTGVAKNLVGEGTAFRRELPPAIGILFQDDFEHDLADGENWNQGVVPGWESNGGRGIFNPTGSGIWYDHAGLEDMGPTKGAIGTMRGPTLGYFIGSSPGAEIRRELGAIAADSTYSVSLGIGVRAEHPRHGEVFDGYTIRLMSGGVTLAMLSSNTPPGPYNSVTSVGFSWDSSKLPQGLRPGAPLAIKISPNHASGGYLDFDNVRVAVLNNPVPTR